MAGPPQSVEELENFETYRAFMKDRLKQLSAEPLELYISKERVDFQIKGKPWPGRAVLLGDTKGAAAVKQLKKDGLLFRAGTCRLEGTELLVEGLSPKLVKDADKTFKKLLLGFSLSAPEGVGGELGDDEDAGELGQPAGASAAENWSALKAELTPEVKAAIARSPELKDRALALLANSSRQEKVEDFEGAIATFEELRTLIAGAGGAQGAAPDPRVFRDCIPIWDKALDAVKSDLAKLKKAVLDAFSADPSQAGAAQGVQKLDEVAKQLDRGLRQKLEQAGATGDAGARSKLHAEVDAQLKQIASALGKDPMIKSLDANPFLSVGIRQTLASALKQISTTVRA